MNGENLPVAQGGHPICGARKRTGEGALCTQPAGWGTDHLGEGKCKLHGGKSPILHGRYSSLTKARIRDLITRHENDPDPTNVYPELGVQRALLQDFLDRYEENRELMQAWYASFKKDGSTETRPREFLDQSDAVRLAAEVTKTVERIERIRSAYAISEPDFIRLMGMMAEVVRMHVTHETAVKIQQGWLELRR